MEDVMDKFGGIENILTAIKNSAAKAGRSTTKMMLELYYVLKSPETSMVNKTIILAALGYQLLPKDLLPRKKYGLLVFVDNGITLAVAYNRVKKSITPEIERQVNDTMNGWFNNGDDGFDEYEVVE